MQISENLINQINKTPINLKAEVVYAKLLELGLTDQDILIELKGAFRRPYSKDIAKSEIDKEVNKLKLQLSRNGIYDMLPEGIFHENTTVTTEKVSLSSFISSYKKQKKEEQQARLFFSPFENFIFKYLVDIELMEQKLVFNSNQFNTFFTTFWDLDNNLATNQILFLLNILPYATNIKGDLKNTIKILECYLEKEISFQISYHTLSYQYDIKTNYVLGKNFIVGNTSDDLPYITFEIKNVSDSELINFLPNGNIRVFIERYFEYFIPIEFDYQIIIQPNFEQPLTGGFGVLGHSSQLQIIKN